MAQDSPLTVRRFLDDDFEVLVRRWHETNITSYRYVAAHQAHTLDDARRFFRDSLLASSEVWVAERGGTLAGMLALDGVWIRQLAVFPGFQRSGVGTALLECAGQRSPAELRLYTFRRNAAARAFYEKQGFSVVALGVSPAPESEPDVEYRRVSAVAASALRA